MRSPSEDTRRIAEAFTKGIQAGLSAPARYVPPTPEEAARWHAQYPPYDITEANAAEAVRIMWRHGLRVEVRYQRRPYDDEPYYLVIVTDPVTGRTDDEDADRLSDALRYAFMGFSNHAGGAIRREIAAGGLPEVPE